VGGGGQLARGTTRELEDALRDSHLRRVAKYEKRMYSIQRRFIRGQINDIVKAIEASPPRSSRELPTGYPEFDWASFGILLNGQIGQAFIAGYDAATAEDDAPVSDAAVEFKKDRLPQIAENVAAERAGYVSAAGQRLAKSINGSIIKSIENGDNLNQMIKGVRSKGVSGLSRARTIARTEANIATTGGTALQAAESGMLYKKWLTEGDDAVRQDHVDAAREGFIYMEETFKSTGTERPGVGGGSQVINCRCRIRYSRRAKNKPIKDLPDTGKGPAPTPIRPPEKPPEPTIPTDPEEFYQFKKSEVEARVKDRMSPRLTELREARLKDGRSLAEQEKALGDEYREQNKKLTERWRDAMATAPNTPERDEAFKARDEQKAIVSDIIGRRNVVRGKQDELKLSYNRKARAVIVEEFGDPSRPAIKNRYAGSKIKEGTYDEPSLFMGQILSDRNRGNLSGLATQGVKANRSYTTNDGKLRMSPKASEPGEWGEKVFVHEASHVVEQRDQGMLDRSTAFQNQRQIDAFGADSNGNPSRGATAMGSGYGRGERALDDSWVEKGGSKYSGLRYNSEISGRATATEVYTMGMERMYDDPIGFIDEDPEYFAWTVASASGEFEQ
jgi:hypothetical protein